MLSLLDALRYCLGSFNPLPALQPGDAVTVGPVCEHQQVSIRSRLCSREMPADLRWADLRGAVSIRSRLCSREMRPT